MKGLSQMQISATSDSPLFIAKTRDFSSKTVINPSVF
jgi:hypothetical protein